MARKHFRWTKPPTQAWKALVYIKALDNWLEHLLNFYWAPQVEASAKVNATWKDHTGNARQTLKAFAYKPTENIWALVLRQTMSYGKYLEMRYQGRYAIVLLTLAQFYDPVWSSIKRGMK